MSVKSLVRICSMNSAMLSNRPINHRYLSSDVNPSLQHGDFFQAAIDLWTLMRYMSQLPADYLTNRISLPSQQAIVSSARSYLEYSFVVQRCSSFALIARFCQISCSTLETIHQSCLRRRSSQTRFGLQTDHSLHSSETPEPRACHRWRKKICLWLFSIDLFSLVGREYRWSPDLVDSLLLFTCWWSAISPQCS